MKLNSTITTNKIEENTLTIRVKATHPKSRSFKAKWELTRRIQKTTRYINKSTQT